MPIVSVTLKDGRIITIPYNTATNLFELLTQHEDTQVRSACQKNGTCGLCLVSIESGTVSDLTYHEIARLNKKQLEKNIRLACQVEVFDTVSVSLINPLIIHALDYLPICSPLANARYQIAVDLGSTQIRLSLWDSIHQQRVASYCYFNPQAYYGTDILQRLMIAKEDSTAMQVMSKLVFSTIRHVLSEWQTKGFLIEQILIVGNTAMLALLAKKHYERLLNPEYWMQYIELSLDIKQLCAIPIDIVQPLAGFVGSDLLAGVLTTHLINTQDTVLFIDFGTNTELALWHQGQLWVTSVPGGPAFEGCGISCGVAAEIGAVARIEYDELTDRFTGELIGDTDVIKGLCGSALCDLVACLIKAKRLKPNGRFVENLPQLEFELGNLNYTVSIEKHDIDVFQRAKAAIGAAIFELLNLAGVSQYQLAKLYIAGAFGQFLNITHAQLIGLLPDCASNQVELVGNTALIGCELLLTDSIYQQDLIHLRQRTHSINLSKIMSYEDAFVHNLFLRPIPLSL